MTRMFLPPRNGSGKKAAGRRKTSESRPSAWPVDDPSKFHSLSCPTSVIGPSRVCSKGDKNQFEISVFICCRSGPRCKGVGCLRRVTASTEALARLCPPFPACLETFTLPHKEYVRAGPNRVQAPNPGSRDSPQPGESNEIRVAYRRLAAKSAVGVNPNVLCSAERTRRRAITTLATCPSRLRSVKAEELLRPPRQACEHAIGPAGAQPGVGGR